MQLIAIIKCKICVKHEQIWHTANKNTNWQKTTTENVIRIIILARLPIINLKICKSVIRIGVWHDYTDIIFKKHVLHILVQRKKTSEKPDSNLFLIRLTSASLIIYYFTSKNRLYKPFALKPWLTVYRAHTGCSTRPGKSWSIWAGNYIVENFGKIKISEHLTIRFEFPVVQPQVRLCRVRFTTRERLENSLDKV